MRRLYTLRLAGGELDRCLARRRLVMLVELRCAGYLSPFSEDLALRRLVILVDLGILLHETWHGGAILCLADRPILFVGLGVAPPCHAYREAYRGAALPCLANSGAICT